MWSILSGIFSAISAFLGWRKEKRIVEAAAAKGSAKALGEQLERERLAGEEKRERDQRQAEDQAELEEKADEAIDDGRSPADAVWRGMFDND